MEQFSRSQRMVIAIGAIVLAVIFASSMIYWTGFAPEHPRIKHDVLFFVLALGSLVIAWFAWPSRRVPQ